MSRFFQRIVFVVSLAVFSALGLGFFLGESGIFGVHAGVDQDGAYRQMGVYAEALKKVQTDYVTEPNITNVTTGALHGLLESLDADSSYLTPTEYKIYRERQTTGIAQVGITVSKRFGYATVVSVLPGSPADKERISDGDVIESIGEQSTRELSLAVIRLMMEGKPGTTVALSVVRPRKSDPEKVTLTRAIVGAGPLGIQQYENATILYLKPGQLTAARVDEIASQIKSVAGKKAKILLDLRDSAGGDAQDGLRLANLFVMQGTLATLEGQKFPLQTFAADPAKCITDAPLAVLINHGTYGAAELTAAAILDLKRGDVVGERSFGEGSVQKVFELPQEKKYPVQFVPEGSSTAKSIELNEALPDPAAILLTVAKYKSPAGKKIQDEAVTPSVVVGAPLGDEEEEAAPAKGDEPLNKALELLKAKTA